MIVHVVLVNIRRFLFNHIAYLINILVLRMKSNKDDAETSTDYDNDNDNDNDKDNNYYYHNLVPRVYPAFTLKAE